MLETTLERRGRRLLKGGGDDEDIPTDSSSLNLHDEQAKEIRLGPITRARAKLIEQQVNFLLTESDVVLNENYIPPNSLYVCMIRYYDEGKAQGGEDKIPDIGRPTIFERPTSATRTATSVYRRPPAKDGLPMEFGRPTSVGYPMKQAPPSQKTNTSATDF